MPGYKTLQAGFAGPHIASIRLNRPEVANAINTSLANELRDAIPLFAEHPDTRVIILTGNGERAFCAGADLKERRGMTLKEWEVQHNAFEHMREAIMESHVPIIAAINGAAYAGGFEIALACDFMYAADHAKFALTEAKLGIMPGLGGTQALPRGCGSRRALEILYTGQPFTAAQALEWGIVNAVFPGESLMQETLKVAETIAANAPLSVRAIKQSVRRGADMALEDALAYELEIYSRLIPTADRQEGINAFNEKRIPAFKGE